MKVSPLLLSIINSRSKWLISFDAAVSNFQLIEKLISKEWDQFEDNKSKLELSAYGTSMMEIDDASSYDSIPKGSTVIIPIKGTMLKDNTWCSYGTSEIANEILKAGTHKNIGSVVLDIDSGGGSADSISPLQYAIEKVDKVLNKPVVASCDLAASAAFWTACSCTKIIANNNISSSFGSIGVMMSFMDLTPMYEKQGYKQHTIYSNLSEHKNLNFQLALKGEYDKIKEEDLDLLALKFQSYVQQQRPSLQKDVPGILSGKMFYADDALKYGLIDNIGNIDTAITEAKNISLIRNFNKSFK
jgi:protease IV